MDFLGFVEQSEGFCEVYEFRRGSLSFYLNIQDFDEFCICV